MPWIEVVPLEKARGVLKKEYEAALQRAGRIWNVVSIFNYINRIADGLGIETEDFIRSWEK